MLHNTRKRTRPQPPALSAPAATPQAPAFAPPAVACSCTPSQHVSPSANQCTRQSSHQTVTTSQSLTVWLSQSRHRPAPVRAYRDQGMHAHVLVPPCHPRDPRGADRFKGITPPEYARELRRLLSSRTNRALLRRAEPPGPKRMRMGSVCTSWNPRNAMNCVE